MIQMLVGSKLAVVVGLVLVVGLISFFTIQYIQQAERDKILLEIQEQQTTTKKVIKDAIKDRPVDPSDATDSLQYLNNRD